MIGRLGIYINVQVFLIRYHTVSVVWPVVSFSFQTHSPRANPESWAWPWFPATTWCPSRWRQTAWTTHRDSELTTDGAPSVWTAFMWLSPAEPDSRPWSIPGERTTSVSDSLDADLLCRCRGFSQSLGDWWKSAFASTAAQCSECRNGVGVHEVWVNESLLVCVSVSAVPVFITVCFKINRPIWDFVLPSSPRFKTQQNKMSKNAFVSIF